jgi:hypothetical protein
MATRPLGRPDRHEVRAAWANSEPVRFFWRGRWRHILHVQEAWVDAGHWWAGEKPLWFYRVATSEGVYELTASETGASMARVYRVYD